jgi:hypothetical protein
MCAGTATSVVPGARNIAGGNINAGKSAGKPGVTTVGKSGTIDIVLIRS